jgi:hypothetical protein
MTDKRVADARDTFRSLIVDNYEMDGEFVEKVCEFWMQTVVPLLETSSDPVTATKKTRAPKATAAPLDSVDKTKKKRKMSAYNVYVREMMKTGDIQRLGHREKMRAIADQWRSLDDVGKATYVTIASSENDPLPEENATV